MTTSAHDVLSRLRENASAAPLGRLAARWRAKAPRAKAPPGGKKRRTPEFDLHVRVVVRLQKRLPHDAALFHAANETGGRDMDVQRIKARRMGVMPGFPDLGVIWRARVLLIELKAENGAVTRTQKWAHEQLRAAGAAVAVCRSIEEVEAFLEAEGVPLA